MAAGKMILLREVRLKGECVCVMQGGKGWQLQRRRREVLEALDQSVRLLLSLEEPLGSWETHSAQAEAALVSAGGGHNYPTSAC